MKNIKAGFTLIELLVVVLIIGILAAVAVPQYQKAVLKSHFVQAKTMGTALSHAMETYYLANGQYTSRLADLDISMPYTSTSIDKTENIPCTDTSSNCYYFTDWGFCGIWTRGEVWCQVHHGNFALSYLHFLPHTTATTWAGNIYCRTQTDATTSDITYKICQAETGSQTPSISWAHDPSFLYQ